MEVTCGGCGAQLRLNPKLAGTTVSCPQCGAAVRVEGPPRRRAPAAEPAPEAPPPPRPRLTLPLRFTLWLLGAQLVVAGIGLSCLAGAFLRKRWIPPPDSYFRENGMLLIVAGIALVVAGWIAHYMPVLTTLLVALFVLGACALHYWTAGNVDASRVVALAAAMFALWLALQHRRANNR